MSENNVSVFFYGLFMDESLLARRSYTLMDIPTGYRLRVPARAALVPEKRSRAYAVLTTIRPEEAADLYSDETVAD